MSGLSITRLRSGGVISNDHCDLCTEIRSFLFHRQAETFPELAPEGFYAELGAESTNSPPPARQPLLEEKRR